MLICVGTCFLHHGQQKPQLSRNHLLRLSQKKLQNQIQNQLQNQIQNQLLPAPAPDPESAPASSRARSRISSCASSSTRTSSRASCNPRYRSQCCQLPCDTKCCSNTNGSDGTVERQHCQLDLRDRLANRSQLRPPVCQLPKSLARPSSWPMIRAFRDWSMQAS